jgi:hypothetical protein
MPPAVQALQGVAVSPDVCPLLANDDQGIERVMPIAADSCTVVPPLANEMRVGHAGDRRGRGAAGRVGSDAVTHQGARQLLSNVLTQKIQVNAILDKDDVIGDRANHWATDEPMMRPAGNVLGRSSVHGNGMGNDVFSHSPKF